jgi:YfiH family protein
LEGLGLKALFTTREYDMSFEGPDRRAAYAKLGIDPSRIVCLQQVHEDRILLAGKKHRGRGGYARATAIQKTDGLVTDERFLPLAIQTADCLPVFLFDPNKRVAALVHAGWRGVFKSIVSKTIRLMRDKFSTEPRDLVVVLGPALRPCCYEVGEEFLDHFPKFVSLENKKLKFDIAAAATAQILKSGALEGRIYDTRMCTSCQSNEFFSFRRQGERAGRSMSILEIL